MEAREKSVNFITKEKKIVIPFFQRPYVWDEDNWKDLFDDLIKDKNHFLGSIIIKQHKRSGEVNEAIVIDGQQRLTTLSILIKAIYDCFDDELKSNTKDKINNCLSYKIEDTDRDWHIKIVHSRKDSEYYEKVVNGEVPEETENESKIFACYHYFVKRLMSIDMNQRAKLFNKILNDDNKMLVVIDINDNEDEQSIFDTINTAGVRLTCADSIKNNIFQRGFEIFGNNSPKVKAMYDEYWEKLFLLDNETIDFWSIEKTTGRFTRSNLEIFLQAYAVIKEIYNPTGDTLSDLTARYKSYFQENSNANNYEGILKEISKYAKLYKDKIINCDPNDEYSSSDTARRLFHVLQVNEITTLHAYILYLFYTFEKDEKQLHQKLNELEQYVVYNSIAKVSERIKNYNKLCVEFIKGDKNPKEELGKISESDFVYGLRNVSNKQATLWLFYIELFRRKTEGKFDKETLNYIYTLEHVMPQKWEEYWSVVPVVNEQGDVIEDIELAKASRRSAIYSLGNMTLLKSKLNTSIRNYTLDKKINGEGNKKGIKEYTELTITNRDVIENYDKSKIWNEKTIYDRTVQLAKELMKCWGFV